MTPDNPALEMWPRVRPTDEQTLTRLAVPYVRWMHQDLVAELAHDNTTHLAAWQQVLQQKHIAPDLYVWAGSACAFPGVRRKPGKAEEKGHCLRFDDTGNRLAHRVWERLGPTMSGFKAERAGYELVHLLPHQPTEWEKLFEQKPELLALLPSEWRKRLTSTGLPALFTNPANMCFLPSVMVRPTDGNSLFRQVLWKKAVVLFGSGALLPPELASPMEQWLQTLPTLPNLDWSKRYHGDKAHLKNVLKDRNVHLNRHQLAQP